MKFKNKKNWYILIISLFFSNSFVFADLKFDSEGTSFILKNSSSKIRLNPSTIYGWRDSSIVNKVSGIGLGDYNLKQYDYNLDNILTYSEVNNSMQYKNWDIPANTVVHIKENIYMDGYGGTISIGENSELFVDDNITLTLRNIVIKSSKNFDSNPAIKLASNRSKLALDNVTLSLANDFYFNCGQLFLYNDVNIDGTNSFIYRSTVPSYITSGACLKFNPGTTFDYRPSTTGTPNLLAKDLLIMQDSTSQLYLDGCSLKTTQTGIRFTRGQLLLDNKIAMTSNAQLQISYLESNVSINYGYYATTVRWSPDGRFVAVTGVSPSSGNEIQIYRFNGSALTLVASKDSSSSLCLNWSPDGMYLATGGSRIEIYQFTGSALNLVAYQNYGDVVRSVNWSPDGQILAVGGDFIGIQIYRFNYSYLSLITSQSYSDSIQSMDWSSDGKYLAVGGSSSGSEVKVYSFNGSSLTLITYIGYVNIVYTAKWSPDGRFIATGGYEAPFNIYSFNGNSLMLMTSQNYGDQVQSANWSTDGRYVTIGGYNPNFGHHTIETYNFNGTAVNRVAYLYASIQVYELDLSPNNQYIAFCGYTGSGNEINVCNVLYESETNTQAISNSIVFGNSALGQNYDLNVRGLAGAQIEIDGLVHYDNVN